MFLGPIMLQSAQFYFHFEEMDIAWLPVPLTTFHINIYIYIGLYIYIYRTRTFLDTCGSQQVFCLNMSTYNLYIYINIQCKSRICCRPRLCTNMQSVVRKLLKRWTSSFTIVERGAVSFCTMTIWSWSDLNKMATNMTTSRTNRRYCFVLCKYMCQYLFQIEDISFCICWMGASVLISYT